MRIERTDSFPQDDKGFPQVNEEFSTGIPQSYEVFHRFVIVFHNLMRFSTGQRRVFHRMIEVFHSFIRVFHRANLINPYKHYNYL